MKKIYTFEYYYKELKNSFYTRINTFLKELSKQDLFYEIKYVSFGEGFVAIIEVDCEE